MVYFADTAFFIALFSKRDQHHDLAVMWPQMLVRRRVRITTTEAVLWEWLNAFSDIARRQTAVEGYKRLHADPQIEVLPFRTDLITAAVLFFERHHDKDWSLSLYSGE